MDKKIKHLEIIQGVINRMAGNSFLLKGWNVILISALFALAAKDSNIRYVYLALFPSVAFWILDAYFLQQGRLYRKLYDKIRQIDDSEVNFSMDTSSVANEVCWWGGVIFSKTLYIFHGAIIATILITIFIISQ